MPDGEDDAREDIEQCRRSNEGHFCVVRIGEHAADDGRHNRDGRRHGGNGINGLDAVALGLEPQGQAAVGGDAVGLGEEKGKADEDPKVPAREDLLEDGEGEGLARLAVVGGHAGLGELDLARGQEEGTRLLGLSREAEEAEDGNGDGAGEADNVQPAPALDAVAEVERGVGAGLDVAGAHAANLAGDEEEGAAAAQFGALVPAAKIPLDGGEEEAAGGADEEANHVELVDARHLVLGEGEDAPDDVGGGNKVAGGEASHLDIISTVKPGSQIIHLWQVAYKNGQGDLQGDEANHVRRVEVVELVSKQVQVLLHAAHVCSARGRLVKDLGPVGQKDKQHDENIELDDESALLGRVGRREPLVPLLTDRLLQWLRWDFSLGDLKLGRFLGIAACWGGRRQGVGLFNGIRHGELLVAACWSFRLPRIDACQGSTTNKPSEPSARCAAFITYLLDI